MISDSCLKPPCMCTLMYVLFALGMSCDMEHILSRIDTVAVLFELFAQPHSSRSMFGSYPLHVYIFPNHTITVYRFALYIICIYITHTKRTSPCLCTLQEFGWHPQQSYHRFNITLPHHQHYGHKRDAHVCAVPAAVQCELCAPTSNE